MVCAGLTTNTRVTLELSAARQSADRASAKMAQARLASTWLRHRSDEMSKSWVTCRKSLRSSVKKAAQLAMGLEMGVARIEKAPS